MVRLDKPISDLADQFIRVRLTQIPRMDLRRFEFDCDLTWYVFFLNSDETIYGRYGGRDASSAESRLSLKGLHYAMTKALALHKAPPQAVKLDGPLVTPERLAAGKSHKGCIHCHNVKEFQRADAIKLGAFDRASLWVYPLPENIGLTLDVDGGTLVKRVVEDSAASKAGMKAGDTVIAVDGRATSSLADISYALHKATTKKLPIVFERGNVDMAATLELTDGWRKTNLTWRPSLLDILPSVAFSGDELTVEEKTKLGMDAKRACFRQESPVHSSLANAGIQAGDVIVGFDDHTANGKLGELLGIVRQNYLVGDTITVKIMRDGIPKEIHLKLK